MTAEPKTNDNGAEGDNGEGSSPATVTTATVKKTTKYALFLGADACRTIVDWASDEGRQLDTNGCYLGVPGHVDTLDLIGLGQYDGYSRDGAVDKMLEEADPSDRVRAVQNASAAEVDLTIDGVPVSYIGEVPIVWERKPTRRIGKAA